MDSSSNLSEVRSLVGEQRQVNEHRAADLQHIPVTEPMDCYSLVSIALGNPFSSSPAVNAP
jgi:hypothetical protein